MEFPFEKNIILENDRVVLRPTIETDFELFLQYALNEPELWKYSLLAGNGEENMRKYLKFALDKKAAKDSYPFTVIDKISGKCAGTTRFYDIQNHHKSLQLGFTWYGKEFQGTGLNTNCKFLMLEFAFENIGAERVEFRADNNNIRSIKAMQKIGAVKEGVLRSNCSAPEGRRDSIILSILKDEWISEKKQLLLNMVKNGR